MSHIRICVNLVTNMLANSALQNTLFVDDTLLLSLQARHVVKEWAQALETMVLGKVFRCIGGSECAHCKFSPRSAAARRSIHIRHGASGVLRWLAVGSHHYSQISPEVGIVA